MRIHTKPYVTQIKDAMVIVHLVSVVGKIPGGLTQYVEQEIGFVDRADRAGELVGAWIIQSCNERKALALFEKKHFQAYEDALNHVVTNAPAEFPKIPGVTTDIGTVIWQNPAFGDKEGHLARHGMKKKEQQNDDTSNQTVSG